ncbi:MAG: peptidoglycan editing factor PgeF [Defluviitaleaceae bacterium]|nr:peptidoglycan editing factor PgeF [Defluviitaleaceae bacterium]
MIKNEKNGIIYYTFKNLARGMVRHAFSTRIGGVSRGCFVSMNLSPNTGDDPATVQENYRLFCDAAGFNAENIVMANQHHTTNIQKVDGLGVLENVDGLMTNRPGIMLVTYYADCVPLMFCDPVRGVIANSHAGWRGTAHNMAGKTVERMTAEYGCNPRDILVGIGPSISRKNFEVGPEVAEDFKVLLPFSARFVYNSESTVNKFHVDLWEINRQNLEAAGILPQNIEVAGMCTYDDGDLFYSHRRDGMARGGMAAFIQL